MPWGFRGKEFLDEMCQELRGSHVVAGGVGSARDAAKAAASDLLPYLLR